MPVLSASISSDCAPSSVSTRFSTMYVSRPTTAGGPTTRSSEGYGSVSCPAIHQPTHSTVIVRMRTTTDSCSFVFLWACTGFNSDVTPFYFSLLRLIYVVYSFDACIVSCFLYAEQVMRLTKFIYLVDSHPPRTGCVAPLHLLGVHSMVGRNLLASVTPSLMQPPFNLPRKHKDTQAPHPNFHAPRTSIRKHSLHRIHRQALQRPFRRLVCLKTQPCSIPLTLQPIMSDHVHLYDQDAWNRVDYVPPFSDSWINEHIARLDAYVHGPAEPAQGR